MVTTSFAGTTSTSPLGLPRLPRCPNRFETLQVVPNSIKHNGSSSMKISQRLSWPVPCIKTASIKKESTGHFNRRVPSAANRRFNIQTGPTSCGGLMPPWGLQGLKMWKESFLPSNGPQIIIHYLFFRHAVMKSKQDAGCLGTTETSRLWDNQLWDQEWK